MYILAFAPCSSKGELWFQHTHVHISVTKEPTRKKKLLKGSVTSKIVKSITIFYSRSFPSDKQNLDLKALWKFNGKPCALENDQASTAVCVFV